MQMEEARGFVLESDTAEQHYVTRPGSECSSAYAQFSEAYICNFAWVSALPVGPRTGTEAG